MRFGLEVVEVFLGKIHPQKGSIRKKEEVANQRRLDKVMTDFRKLGGPALDVQLVGNIDERNLKQLLPALLRADIQNDYHAPRQEIFVESNAGSLRTYFRKADKARWMYIDERIGFVWRDAHERVSEAVRAKAGNLEDYKANCSLDDVRLLIVANRLQSSGKLDLPSNAALDLCGFSEVYFLPYPEPMVRLASV